MKYNPEDKRIILKTIRRKVNPLTVKEASKKFGIRVQTINSWLNAPVIKTRLAYKKYSNEEKCLAINLYKEGKSLSQISKAIGCAQWTLKGWLDNSDDIEATDRLSSSELTGILNYIEETEYTNYM